MPTIIGESRPAAFDGRPARMSQEDYGIWQRWIVRQRAKIQRMHFDVGLGDGQEAPSQAPDNFRRMWLRNTQKRADAVLETTDGLWLIELRFDANSNAIGRLKLYEQLYAEDPILGPLSQCVLVSNIHYSELKALSATLGISYHIV